MAQAGIAILYTLESFVLIQTKSDSCRRFEDFGSHIKSKLVQIWLDIRYENDLEVKMLKNSPFRIDENENAGIITAKKQFFTGECILNVASEFSNEFFISFDATSDDSVIFIHITQKNNGKISETPLREFMNRLIDPQNWLDLSKNWDLFAKKLSQKLLRQ